MPIDVEILEAFPRRNAAVVRVVHDGRVLVEGKALRVPVYGGERRLDLFERKIRELAEAEYIHREFRRFATPVRVHRAAR